MGKSIVTNCPALKFKGSSFSTFAQNRLVVELSSSILIILLLYHFQATGELQFLIYELRLKIYFIE
jgi:hypothetical protein